MRIAILVPPRNASPLILAHSLQNQLKDAGVISEISEEIDVLNRLVSYKNSSLNFHFWVWKKIRNYFSDRRILKWLKGIDAVIICDCIPNGFWKRLYNVEKLKTIIQKPVLFYEVFYLGNAPTQVADLKRNHDPLLERYDAHLFVSPVTEIRSKDPVDGHAIGLMAKTWNIQPLPKKEIIALVDFAQSGYEAYREIQIAQLKKAGIRYISLEGSYTIDKIRDIYRRASVFFVQFPEAFGLPILECLCAGAQVFTPDSGWPMSWRLNEDPVTHGPGVLPKCFTVYSGEDELLQKLLEFKENFDSVETPLKIFGYFIKQYPFFYEGNSEELKKCLEQIKRTRN